MESGRNFESGSNENDEGSSGAFDSELVDLRIKTPLNNSNTNIVDETTSFPSVCMIQYS